MRKRYEKLIGTVYTPNNVYIRSSDTDRTLISALCTAAGLFPPSEAEIWKIGLNWQPIPIHTIPLSEDYLVYQAIPCPKFDKLREEYYMKSPEIEVLFRNYSALIEYLEDNSGKKIRSLRDLGSFDDPLRIEEFRGLT